ncbi:hypothetical protein [Celeribacter halophilus]|uniref:hypothetical protein n=1 Tax=Celeribacter halophilus TaxID=576117 RepID=UPI003BB87534
MSEKRSHTSLMLLRFSKIECLKFFEKRFMIRKKNTKLSLTRQCKLLKISRSSLYYTPVGMNAETLKLMNEIDRVFTKHPFFPSRACKDALPGSGQPPDCSLPSPIWVLGWAASCASSDGHYGIAGRIQGAKHQQEASTAPHLPVPAVKAGNHAT